MRYLAQFFVLALIFFTGSALQARGLDKTQFAGETINAVLKCGLHQSAHLFKPNIHKRYFEQSNQEKLKESPCSLEKLLNPARPWCFRTSKEPMGKLEDINALIQVLFGFHSDIRVSYYGQSLLVESLEIYKTRNEDFDKSPHKDDVIGIHISFKNSELTDKAYMVRCID